MIGEILLISQDKFYDFVYSVKGFFSENEWMICQYECVDYLIVVVLFCNMYMIKGNVCMYSLQYLMNIVYEVEQVYELLCCVDSGFEWNCDVLMEDLVCVCEVVDYYVMINVVMFGCSGELVQYGVDYLMVECVYISESLCVFDGVDLVNVFDWYVVCDVVWCMLSQFGM